MSVKLLGKKGYIGKLEIKNRLVMTAMGVGLGEFEGNATDEFIQFYAERAKGGAGLIITEITRVNEETGIGEYDQLSLAKDSTIPSFKKLADAMHQYDTKVFAQLHHPGRETFTLLTGGKPVVSASPIPSTMGQQPTRALETEEVESLVRDFANAAVRAKKAGMDGVEIHAAHGYLIAQFLSSHSNKRTDKYGSTYENRVRFLLEIVTAIKAACGNEYPVSVRISSSEFYEAIGIRDGITLEESIKTAVACEKAGADLINISAGCYDTGNTIVEPTSYEQGWKIDLAKVIKGHVRVPVVATSVIREPEYAESLLEQGYTDFIGMGRSWLADSKWGVKALQGRSSDIRKCTGCMYCFEIAGTQLVQGGEGTTCAVNPRVGKETKYAKLNKDGAGRKVVIVGAGPGGMEAAMILSKRSFNVTLLEKNEYLGGQMHLSSIPPHKQKMGWFIQYCEKQMKDYNVDIRLNVDATADMIKKMDPYAIIISTGSAPVLPRSITGIDGENVYTPVDILSRKVSLNGKQVCIVGSGLTGLETGEYLAADPDNEVMIYEMQDKIGPDAFVLVQMDVTAALAKAGVRMFPGHRLLEIKKDRIILEDNAGIIVKQHCDAVVISLGVRPVDILQEELKDLPNVYAIGDADKIGRVAHAVESGFETAWNLK